MIPERWPQTCLGSTLWDHFKKESGTPGFWSLAAPPAPSLDSGPPAEKRKRRDAQLPAFKVHKKVADAPRARAPAAAPAAAPVEAPAGCGGGLPGMDAYGDDDSD